jgi:hypothetical protein
MPSRNADKLATTETPMILTAEWLQNEKEHIAYAIPFSFKCIMWQYCFSYFDV